MSLARGFAFSAKLRQAKAAEMPKASWLQNEV